MKNTFKGYYKYSESEFKKIWKDCIFVPDANVLLNIYRYSNSTADELIDIFNENKNRLWIPHQVGLEFQGNHIDLINEQANKYNWLKKFLDDELKRIIKTLQNVRHPYIDSEILIKKLNRVFGGIVKELNKNEKNHPDLLGNPENDKYRKELTEIFNKKVGPPDPKIKDGNIPKEWKSRFERKVPPGYKDDKKGEEDNKYGDLVIWLQTIKKAKSEKKPIIFITDDRKEDWWLIKNGKTLGPRPELVQEMHDQAKVDFYMYQTYQFMNYAKTYLKSKVSEKSVDEIRDLRTAWGGIDWPELDLKTYLGLDTSELELAVNKMKFDTLASQALGSISGLDTSELESAVNKLKINTLASQALGNSSSTKNAMDTLNSNSFQYALNALSLLNKSSVVASNLSRFNIPSDDSSQEDSNSEGSENCDDDDDEDSAFVKS
jgi:hypothetical protein